MRRPESVVEPVPPCATERAVVKPESEVMSELAPLAAAPRLVRAPLAVVAPVPPKLIPIVVDAEATPVAEVTRIPLGALEIVRFVVEAVPK